MALLEAASSELPIITTSVGGAEELLEDGVSALFVSERSLTLATAMERLADDYSLRIRLGKEARKSVAEKCDLEVTTRRFYDAIFQAIDAA